MFLTEWTFERTVEYDKKVLHLWSRQHKEGYTAYTFTHQPVDGRTHSIPIGNSHYTSLEGLSKTTGIPMELLGA